MKPYIAMFMLGLAVAGGITYKLGYFSNVTSYTNQAEERVIDNTPDWAIDEDAVKAAQDVLRRKELESELESLKAEKTAEIERHDQEFDRINAEIEKREKELGLF